MSNINMFEKATFKNRQATCNLDRGICSNQFGMGYLTGCHSTEPCKIKTKLNAQNVRPACLRRRDWYEKINII